MGGGGGSSKQTVNTKAEPWSGVQPYLKTLYGQVGSQVNTPVQYFPGKGYVPMSAQMQQGIGQNVAFAKQQIPAMYNQGNYANNQLLKSMDVANNPYVNAMNQSFSNMYQQNVGQAMSDLTNQFRNQIMPTLTNDALLSGGFGGTRQGVAEGLAVANAANSARDIMQSANNTLASNIAQTNLGAYGQGLNAAQGAIGNLGALSQLGMLPGEVLQRAGGLYEGYNQRALDAEMARWNFNQNEPWQRYAAANAIYNGASPYASQSQTSTNPNTSNPWATAMGIGSIGYGLFGGRA